jgi:uncharacterized repeat protein (TIGR03803 family)
MAEMKIICIGLLASTVGLALPLQVPSEAAAQTRERVLHTFGSGTDGANPYASLIDVNNILYGTTQNGGTYKGGTAFALDPHTGAETVLHAFGSGVNGKTPTPA